MELNYIFKKKIINDLFTKYDFIKTLIHENEKNSENEENSEDNNNSEMKKKQKKMCENSREIKIYI